MRLYNVGGVPVQHESLPGGFCPAGGSVEVSWRSRPDDLPAAMQTGTEMKATLGELRAASDEAGERASKAQKAFAATTPEHKDRDRLAAALKAANDAYVAAQVALNQQQRVVDGFARVIASEEPPAAPKRERRER